MTSLFKKLKEKRRVLSLPRLPGTQCGKLSAKKEKDSFI
jgi:hypothetical protein